jgi:glutathione-regulated potassium-efflux system ancillary protein KefC
MEHNLLSNALIYLSAAVLAVPLAKRLGLGAMLGYLLVGMAIGPWGLRLISEVQDILHFSEFGVVLLLFVIGLELDPKRLWSLRRSIFGWGAAQMGLCSALLAGCGLLLGVDWRVALIAALGLSLSSTAIALTTLQERHLMATAVGAAGFAILLFQDMAAIPMIALMPLLGSAAQAHGEGMGWLGALKAAGMILVLVLSGRHLLRPVLRIIAKTEMREIFTAFALLLVIGIGLLVQSVGLSMALGTFLAGVLLADSEYRHALNSDLEPFKGLLLGLFFIAVGMSVDFGVLLARPGMVAALLALFLTLKIGVLYLLGRRIEIPRGQQALFPILLSQGGEFAFVVFAAAATAGIFTPAVGSVLIGVVALSMVATPLLLLLHDRLIAPHFSPPPPSDAIPSQDNPVIIAGFGTVGQIVGRLLMANRISATVLDRDPDQVELLRKYGFKVFYGDATRTDLLHAAGAGNARILVVAIDDIHDSLALVDAARREFPHLQILARACNVSHYYDLLDRGVTIIERDTFEASLQLGDKLLQQLGFSAARSHRLVQKFRVHNVQTLMAMYPHYKDQARIVSMMKEGRQELEEMFARDADELKSADHNDT